MAKIKVFEVLPEIIGESYYIVRLKSMVFDDIDLKFNTKYEIIAQDFTSKNEGEIWLFNHRKSLKAQGFLAIEVE